MLPKTLQADQFVQYPSQARRLAAAHVVMLRQLPLSFLPGLLRELIEYDYKFPAERASIDQELAALSALSDTQREEWFRGFCGLKLSSQLEHLDWVNQPALFVEQESAYLWTTRQLDAFSAAAMAYGGRLRAASAPETLPARRLGIAVIGQGVATYDGPLFQNLRTQGTYFSQIRPDTGLELLLAAVEARAKAHPAPYAHWYVDGGDLLRQSASLTTVSYAALEPVRANLLTYMHAEIARPGMGPEQLRTDMAKLQPADLGMSANDDPVLARFQMKVFTEGSGTQIFSTTFAQWTAREALRRAQPLTLLVRFAPRQRQRPMNELLSNASSNAELDVAGSLVDADMGAYYHWINQQRLTGAKDSAFLVWFEGHNQALVVAPTMPRGAQSDSALDLAGLVRLATS
jgi:hypothetical protein